jgi:hypothetical protein
MSYASGRAFRTLGEGLQGIGQTVGGLRREREEDERRRAYEDMQEELMFVDRGGGMGPAPQMERTIRGELPEPDLGPASVIPEMPGPGLSMASVDRAGMLAPPDFGSRDAPTLTEPDPRYAEVGTGHVMKPGVMEDMQRLERGQRISSGVSDVMGPDAPQGTVQGIGRLLAEGVNPTELMPETGGDVNWQRVTDETGAVWQVNPRTGEKRPLGITERVPAGTGPRPGGLPTYRQAIETLTTMFPGEFEGESSLSNPELHRMATAMTRGDEVFPEPSIGGPDRGAMAGYPAASIERVMQNYQRRVGSGAPEAAGAVPEPIASSPDQPDTGLALPEPTTRPDSATRRQEITRDQADYMRTVRGWTDEQINQRYTVR